MKTIGARMQHCNVCVFKNLGRLCFCFCRYNDESLPDSDGCPADTRLTTVVVYCEDRAANSDSDPPPVSATVRAPNVP